MATTITNMRGIPLRNPTVGILRIIHNIIRSTAPGSPPSTFGDFSLEFQFNPQSDLSSSENALSFTSGILPAVYYRADVEIADQIATFAFNHVSSRGWIYGLSMSVIMETVDVFEERRSEEARDDDLLDSNSDLSDDLSDSGSDSSEDYGEVDDFLLDGMIEDEEPFEVNGDCYGNTLGMSEREISMLRTEQVSGDEEGECCCICLEGFKRGVVSTSLCPCSHRFHHSCIVQWLRKTRTCPICRSRCTVPTS